MRRSNSETTCGDKAERRTEESLQDGRPHGTDTGYDDTDRTSADEAGQRRNGGKRHHITGQQLHAVPGRVTAGAAETAGTSRLAKPSSKHLRIVNRAALGIFRKP